MTPCLGAVQDQGFRVALVTDGRMSGASGKVAAAIYMSPEALDGDPLSLDASTGLLQIMLDDEIMTVRDNAIYTSPDDLLPNSLGRGLFEMFRQAAGVAHDGASVFK